MVIKSRSMGLTDHVARVGEIMNIELWSEYTKGRDYYGDIGVNGRMILKWILKEDDIWL
jgi:hypothetical protein